MSAGDASAIAVPPRLPREGPPTIASCQKLVGSTPASQMRSCRSVLETYDRHMRFGLLGLAGTEPPPLSPVDEFREADTIADTGASTA